MVKSTFIRRAHPVERDGELIGLVLAAVSVERLSSFISNHVMEQSKGNRFILYGNDQVLAHWLLADGYSGGTLEQPLPPVNRFGDPVLASIWQDESRREPLLQLPEGTSGHRLEAFNRSYGFVYQKQEGFGPEPLIVGTYFQSSDFSEEIRRLSFALLAGLVALLLSLIAAIALGHRIAQPIVRFSSAASRIRYLEVSKVQKLPGSRLRELNEQSVAFNTMLKALNWFEMYVPKKVVDRLIRHGDLQDIISDAREVTVMFTDVTGFSAVSEGMQASELAAFVNCIEQYGGTVDKYMGDAVMAFWDDVDDPAHGAENACQAALAIGRAIREDNRARSERDEPAVGIRIGIHTGFATIGNIGAPGRLNYTIIGDSVNMVKDLNDWVRNSIPRMRRLQY
jgi:class 3 adenylate cyclase